MWAALLAAGLGMSAGTDAWALPPTPRQRIDAVLEPLTTALTEVTATDEERAQLRDVTDRAEALAAHVVELEVRGGGRESEHGRRAVRDLARLARGRIEALRAEGAAAEAEHAVVAAEERRVQARAALERAVEHRLDEERLTQQSPEAAPSAAPSASPARGRPAAAPARTAPARGGR